MIKSTQEDLLSKKENDKLKRMLVTSEAGKNKFFRLKQKFQDSQARFKKIFDEFTFGNKIIDSDLKIIKVNQALIQLLGYSKSELLGKLITDFSHPEFVKGWKKLQHELWTLKKTSFSIESCLIKKDKSCVWCEITSIVYEDNKEVLGYTIIQDITARKNLEEDLLQQQQNLLEAIVNTQEEERRRISENLHNSLGQLLYAAKIALELIKLQDVTRTEENERSLSRSKALLSDCIAESRRMSHELMPRSLDDFGLKAAVNEICNQLSGTTKFDCSISGRSLKPNKNLEIAIYRIVQELMMNVVKHSKATLALVYINIQKKQIYIKVEDNGKGFIIDNPDKKGIGLQIIQNNLRHFNGKMKVSSSSSNGTIVNVTLPNITIN
jgi:PAS domain S-box-containing protein